MKRIERAIISVTDKAGIVDFSKSLFEMGVEILSTGGTAKVIREGGVEVKDISEYTGFPEMLDGRVKTLHPKVHGGLLGVRDNPEHVRMMEENGIINIDMIVVNLYQFEKTVAKDSVTLEDAIENFNELKGLRLEWIEKAAKMDDWHKSMKVFMTGFSPSGTPDQRETFLTDAIKKVKETYSREDISSYLTWAIREIADRMVEKRG